MAISVKVNANELCMQVMAVFVWLRLVAYIYHMHMQCVVLNGPPV